MTFETLTPGLAEAGKNTGAPHDPLHIWNGLNGPEDVSKWVEFHLTSAREAIAELASATAERTVANTLAPFDRASCHLRTCGSQAHVMFMVHPLAGVRDAAQALSQQISAEAVALSLNQDVHRALLAVDASAEDEATRYYLERTLLAYRLAGVDRDEPTRERIRALADRSTELAMQFSRRVQDDVRRIEVEDPNELSGLPADYLARHGVREVTNENGTTLVADRPVVITTDPPEMAPVMSYASSPKLRRRLYLAYNDRGYPANKQVLLDLLAAREEMAHLLGFRSFADLATADQMMGSAANLRKFLDEVEAAARGTANREWGELEAFVRERDPGAVPLTLSDARFWEEQFRRERYEFNSQSVRPYFPFAQVQQGILAVAGKLFGVRFVRNESASKWDSAVQIFDVFDSEAEPSTEATPIGLIYLDMHPREGKSKWFSECSLVPGLAGRQIPEASLVCNFPQPTENDPGLLQYSDVVTFFHEFGHLMHEVLGGRQRWAGQSGIATEGDFVEVPSQMLEEFFDEADLLRTFARHVETGEPIRYETVARMVRASAQGRAMSTLTQVMYATYSMETHDRRAAEVDLDTLLRDGYDRFSRYEFVDGNRMYAAFTHLIGYTSNYYTYLYDKVIALEFFRRFAAKEGSKSGGETLNGELGRQYRRAVLEPGGSKPARALVKAFLGQENVSMDALQAWISREYA